MRLQPFDWEMRWCWGAYSTTPAGAERMACALSEVGLEPYVDHRGPGKTSILWWDHALSPAEWALVDKAAQL